jgi:hypothetical protein
MNQDKNFAIAGGSFGGHRRRQGGVLFRTATSSGTLPETAVRPVSIR